jgi:predicted TIM-barrel fold metal-dependent hydrolase
MNYRSAVCVSALLGVVSAVAIVGCRNSPDTYTMADFTAVKKIDAHVHDNAHAGTFVKAAASDGFRLLSINVDYPDFPPMEMQQEVAELHHRDSPETFAYVSTFSVAGWDSADWVGKVMKHIDSTLARGAVAVKFWKNIGMVLKERNGKMVMLDDARFDPIFKSLSDRKIPVVSHCGEPRDCWLAVADMMSNDMKDYFSHHPQYHMYLHPEMPSYEDQVNARNNMLAKNPALTVVGAHLGSLEWNVDRIAAFLDAFPKASVDMAARMDYLQVQSQKNWQKVHDFLCKYDERILYATDLVVNPSDDSTAAAGQIHAKWLSDWKYLATDSVMSVGCVDGTFRGLALPRSVIDRIYRENAERVFGAVWGKELAASTSR